MSQDKDFEYMAGACLVAYKSIQKSGTPEIQATMRIVLFQIGQELASREKREKKKLRLV